MKYIAIDLETIGLMPYDGTIWMLSVTKDKKTIVLHDCNGNTKYFKDYKAILEDKSVCKIIHNAEFDAPYIELNTGIRVRNIWDTSLVETVIQGLQIPRGSDNEQLKKEHSSSLKYTLPRYGFASPDKNITKQFIDRPKGVPFTKEELHYAGGDTKFLPALQQAQEFLLKRDGGLETALLENKVVEVVAQMKVKGLGVDEKLWNRIADANLKEYQHILATLPHIQNWNSPKQIKAFFFNRGIQIKELKEIPALIASTNDPLLKTLHSAREMYSDATAYGRKWLLDDNGASVVCSDGRIRTYWQQIINTGRFATSNPNILALPKEGNQRSAIVPAPGNVFIIGDYSGQEIGIIAAASQEDLWINALLRDESVHSLVAAQLFPDEWNKYCEHGCTFPKKCKCKGHQDVTGLPYYKGKKLNFMLTYGGGEKKFAEITGCNIKVARSIVYKYKRVARKPTRYLEWNAAIALRTGVAYSADPYKRRMVLKGDEDWQIENQGKNYPIQAAGANMLKLAMISIPEQYPIILPFHDELVLEVPKKVAQKACKVMETVMCDSADYITGIHGLIKVKPRIALNFSKK